MGFGSEAPDTPDFMDYAQQAVLQHQLQKDLLGEQTQVNRPTQYTPFGSVTWEEDPETGQWTQAVRLPEKVQRALGLQKDLAVGRGELANEMMGDVAGRLTGGFGWDPMSANEVMTAEGARDAAEEAIYGRATSRLDPYWDQQTSQRETQLWNQGLRPGDEAWDVAMGNLSRARTDAYQTAMNEAIMGGGREAERSFGMDMMRRQQAIGEALRQRTQGLNELNTLMSGQTIGAPQFPGFRGAGVAQAPDLLGAQQAAYQADLDAYNAQQARNQGLWSGVTGLVGAIPGIWGMF